ncbi:M1 family metallopeptidase [Dyella acidiphila]|uniref:M1 family metallopeptidase n=1 Tax=Dyella acidiphila TaxID=2775866 RepID=UPI001CE4756A|nr:M1 family metallopeptidase [Dyella acidiphila]
MPEWAQPLLYRVALRVDPEQARFSGDVDITVALRKPSDHLWLHGQGLQVDRASVTDAAGTAHAAHYREVLADVGVARIDLDGVLPAQTIHLRMHYSAALADGVQGLYKTQQGGQAYAMAQMEPISARTVFPCFDEPAFRASFALSLTVPARDIALANTRQIAQAAAGPGWKTVVFAPSKPLPTYLLAFGVGPWDVRSAASIAPDAYRNTPLPLRSIGYAGEADSMRRVAAFTPSIIQALENYYGYGYPWDKLDLINLGGGMENPGLVVLDDVGSGVPQPSPAAMRGAFNLAAHEFAHQWTGNTVTMAWWTDTWLSEAFTTWMQQKITMQLHPEYRGDLDRVKLLQRAMANDSLLSARAIRQPVQGNGDIMNAFDDITYEKGAGVLGMFEHYLGEAAFQQGLRAYVHQHAMQSVAAAAVVDAIAQQASDSAAVKRAFYSFLDQNGVPYVRAKVLTQHGQTVLQLAQMRYLPLGANGDGERHWGIPVCVRYSTAAGSRDACTLLDTAQATLALPGADAASWVMPNAGAQGYYRYALDSHSLATLAAHTARLSDVEQLAYADAIEASFHHGDIDAGEVLAALRPLADAPAREVATAPLAQVAWIYRHLAHTDAQRAAVVQWVTTAYLPHLQRLGYQARAGESDGDALWRTALVPPLAFEFKLPAVRAVLLQQGDALLAAMRNGSFDAQHVDREMAIAALGVAVQERGEAALQTLATAEEGGGDSVWQRQLVQAMAHANDSPSAAQLRALALDPKLDGVAMLGLLMTTDGNVMDRDARWQWFDAHLPKLLAGLPGPAAAYMPSMLAMEACSDADATRLQAMFGGAAAQVPGVARGVAQAGETIHLCGALRAAQDPAALTR